MASARLTKRGLLVSPRRGFYLIIRGEDRDFIKAHLETLAACDFFTTEVWTASGSTPTAQFNLRNASIARNSGAIANTCHRAEST